MPIDEAKKDGVTTAPSFQRVARTRVYNKSLFHPTKYKAEGGNYMYMYNSANTARTDSCFSIVLLFGLFFTFFMKSWPGKSRPLEDVPVV